MMIGAATSVSHGTSCSSAAGAAAGVAAASSRPLRGQRLGLARHFASFFQVQLPHGRGSCARGGRASPQRWGAGALVAASTPIVARRRRRRQPRTRLAAAAAAPPPLPAQEGGEETSTEEWTASWRRRRLRAVADDLDWSRCFVSVLFVDSAETPSYVRARLAQRLLDAVANWNGLGKVIEAYSCTPAADASMDEDDEDDWLERGVDLGRHARAAASDFAKNVGLDEEELDHILRKLGAAWSATLCEEDLREHDLIVALDRASQDEVVVELQRQGLDPKAPRLLLLSDLAWHYEANASDIGSALCVDGSGADFLHERMYRALSRCDFERQCRAEEPTSSLARWALDTPPWPADSATPAAATSQERPGDWRLLHCALLRGCTGLVWLLVSSWREHYSNPLSR